jgi:hypothetical protein
MSALLMTPAVWRTPEQRRGVTLADVLNPLSPYKEEDWLPAGIRPDYLQPKAHVLEAAQKALQAARPSANEAHMGAVAVLSTEKPLKGATKAFDMAPATCAASSALEVDLTKAAATKKRRPRKTVTKEASGNEADKPKKTRAKIKKDPARNDPNDLSTGVQ